MNKPKKSPVTAKNVDETHASPPRPAKVTTKRVVNERLRELEDHTPIMRTELFSQAAQIASLALQLAKFARETGESRQPEDFLGSAGKLIYDAAIMLGRDEWQERREAEEQRRERESQEIRESLTSLADIVGKGAKGVWVSIDNQTSGEGEFRLGPYNSKAGWLGFLEAYCKAEINSWLDFTLLFSHKPTTRQSLLEMIAGGQLDKAESLIAQKTVIFEYAVLIHKAAKASKNVSPTPDELLNRWTDLASIAMAGGLTQEWYSTGIPRETLKHLANYKIASNRAKGPKPKKQVACSSQRKKSPSNLKKSL